MSAEWERIQGVSVFWRLLPLIGLGSIVAVAVISAGPSLGQTNIDQGKPASELFANYCAVCHKSTRGLANGRSSLTLSLFLREHYAASREQAAALAAYVISAGGNAPAAKPERAKSEEPKGQEAKGQEAKGQEAKGQEEKGQKPRAASAKSEPENRPVGASRDVKNRRLPNKSLLLSLPHLPPARRRVLAKLRSSEQRQALACRPNRSRTTTRPCRATIFLTDHRIPD